MGDLKIVRRRPEREFAELLAASPAARTVAKRFTSMKVAAPVEESSEEFAGGVRTPTDDEMLLIARYLRSPKQPEQLAVFDTKSCNDLMDRDLDRFRTSCVRSFAKLPEPYSSVGKSYMVSHNTMSLPVGRIFDVGTQQLGDATFLTNKVYMARTAQNEQFLESVDFGIYWAVSVGVMLGTSECTVGKPHQFTSSWWCSQAHEKGLYYDPDSDEVDSWGWPLPVAAGDKGAVQCTREFDDPTDFYELSQVYLGAQYFAELTRSPELAGVVKSASKTIPVVGLRTEEADALPLVHVNSKVVEAHTLYKVSILADGTRQWVDGGGFIYTYDAGSDEVLCLGKEASPGLASHKADATARLGVARQRLREVKKLLVVRAPEGAGDDEDEDPVDLAQAVDAALDQVQSELDQVSDQEDEHLQQALDALTAAETTIDELVEQLGGTDPDDADSNKNANPDTGGTMSKKAVLAAAKVAGLPATVMAKLEHSDDATAVSVALGAAGEYIATLEAKVGSDASKVAAGESYLSTLREAAKAAYVRAKQHGDAGQGVSTTHVDRLISLAGDDAELLAAMLAEYTSEAQSKFPSSVRRSSFPDDANKPLPGDTMQTASEHNPASSIALVQRIHGR